MNILVDMHTLRIGWQARGLPPIKHRKLARYLKNHYRDRGISSKLIAAFPYETDDGSDFISILKRAGFTIDNGRWLDLLHKYKPFAVVTSNRATALWALTPEVWFPFQPVGLLRDGSVFHKINSRFVS